MKRCLDHTDIIKTSKTCQIPAKLIPVGFQLNLSSYRPRNLTLNGQSHQFYLTQVSKQATIIHTAQYTMSNFRDTALQ